MEVRGQDGERFCVSWAILFSLSLSSLKDHSSFILASDVLDDSVLFLHIADARVIYELLGQMLCSVYVLQKTAACMKNIGELKDATDVYEHGELIILHLVLGHAHFIP
ncbi:hypothetical protein BJ165DRAFT_1511948 [Panaeolus papilionaceus]|nr:hypothetical protein BJ165DRAFT_1511948 [Panaeolus papilionaceus]